MILKRQHAARTLGTYLLSMGATLLFFCMPADAEPVQCPVALWDDMSALFESAVPLDLLDEMPLVRGETLLVEGEGVQVSVKRSDGLKVDALFPGVSLRQMITLSIPEQQRPEITQETDGVGLWIKADPYVYLDLLFTDAGGNLVRIPAHRQKEKQWEYAGAPLKSLILDVGGGGRGAVDLPVRFAGIRLHADKRGFKKSFTAELRGLERLNRPDEDQPQKLVIDLIEAPLGHIYRPGDTVEAVFSAPDKKGVVHWTLKSFNDETAAKGQGKGRVKAMVELRDPGHYRFLVELEQDGRRTDYRSLQLAALNKPRQTHERIGICAHWSRDYYLVDELPLLREVGVKYTRDERAWHYVEKKPGVLELPVAMTEFLEVAKEQNVKGMSIWFGQATHYGGGLPQTSEEIKAFTDYCIYTGKAYRGVYDRIEFWNEWSHGTGMEGYDGRTPEQYVQFAEQVVPVLRKELPWVELTGLGGENPYRFMDQIKAIIEAGAGQFFDNLSLHPYRQPFPPEIRHQSGSESLDETIAEFSALTKKYGAPAKIQISEIGYPTFPISWGVSEKEHARYLVRTMALLHSQPEVEQVYWYSLRDELAVPLRENSQTSIYYSQHAYGLFLDPRYAYAPKPAAVALATYVSQTAGGIFGPVHKEDNGLHRVDVSEPGGTKRCSIFWTVDQPVEIKLAEKHNEFIDIMGNHRELKGNVLRVSKNPVYLPGPADIHPKHR